jgi:L-alanine-DL-glutamate epimerase-like enolase superfamily enzyme
MRKIIVMAFGAALMVASTAQLAAVAEHHHARKVERATTSEPFRNANNSVASPAQPGWYYGGYSAPAGH